jgi:hypothetical protein
MMKRLQISFIFFFFVVISFAQDTTVFYKNQSFQLTDVVVRNNFNIPAFIDYVRNDTTFYKAFKNLRILNFTSLNYIRMKDKRGNISASLDSKTRQTYANGCRTMEVLEEKTSGDFYDGTDYNYTTAELYASLFFTKGKVCGETNIIGAKSFSTKGKSGIAKHKEQLKQLFFNPGHKIPGIPFIGDKIALFDEDVASLYDFKIDKRDYMGQSCYVFAITPRIDLTTGEKGKIVIDEMTTWFNAQSLEIIGRNYNLSYKTGVYDFNVNMEIQLEKIGELLVPKVLRYKGEWDVVFKKKERADFTATLFDFKR